MQMQIHRMGLKPFPASTFAFAINTMFNIDGDANADVKCEQALTLRLKQFVRFVTH